MIVVQMYLHDFQLNLGRSSLGICKTDILTLRLEEWQTPKPNSESYGGVYQVTRYISGPWGRKVAKFLQELCYT